SLAGEGDSVALLSPSDMAACLAPGRVGWGHVRSLDEALAAGAERADFRRDRRIEALAEHGEDRDVTERTTHPTGQSPPQRRLLDEAELARDAEAGLVARLDPDLDPVRFADLEARARQRGRRLGHDSLPRPARANPVTDLEPARP